MEYQRRISNDWVVRYKNRFFQLPRQSRHYAPARSQVTVCEWEDGAIAIEYRGQALAWQEITAPVPRQDYAERAEKASGLAKQPKRVKTIRDKQNTNYKRGHFNRGKNGDILKEV